MDERPRTIFANAIRARTTAAELVLDFGIFLPKSEEEAKAGIPDDFSFDIQVIMNIAQLEALSASLQTMVSAIASGKAASAPDARKTQ